MSFFLHYNAQTTINNINGATNVFKLQEALGSNANYIPIKNHMDSLVQNGFLNDTLEDGDAANFARWNWFWSGRTIDPSTPANNGKFSNYLALMQQFILTNCAANPTNIQYNWNLLGPVQMTDQKIGRIDIVKTLPNSPLSTVLYAGAPTGGLWRTNNYTVTNPVWTNITDNIGLPFIGVSGFEFDPTDNNTAYIIASYKEWTNFSMGVFKTTNLSAAQPIWTKILDGPIDQNTNLPTLDFQIRKILTHPTNANELYVLRNEELLRSVNGGATFTTLATLPTLTQLNLPNAINHTAFDFILDKNDPAVIYITSQVVISYLPTNFGTQEGHLWKVVVPVPSVPPTPVQFSDITNLLSISPSFPKTHMRLSNGNLGTYIIYPTTSNFSNYTIDKTINAGQSWSFMSQNSNTSSKLSIFEVSDINENIIYTEGGNPGTNSLSRKIIKSFNGGATFKEQNPYSNFIGGVFTHADVRGFHMLNASADGLNDEFFVSNDGGILYSNSSNNLTGTAHQVNWQNKNGNGLAVTQFFGMGQTKKGRDVFAGGAQDNGMQLFDNGWVNNTMGDGYEILFLKDTPNIGLRQDGKETKATYSRSTNYLIPTSGTAPVSGVLDVILNNGCNTSHMNQEIVEANGALYLPYHDIHKSTDQGATWTNISNFTTTNGAFNIPYNFVLEGLAVGHQNQNTIYAAFSGITYNRDLSPLTNSCASPASDTCPTANCLLEKKFFKTTDGGATWTDISSNFDGPGNSGLAIRWFGITDLTISTTDDNKVWAAFDGAGNETTLCNGLDRVNMTTDGGLTWTDYSNGLPYLPVNKIVYYEGTNDGLFVGNDVGVYYTDADLYPVHGWIKLDLGLPAAFVTDIDLNYCRGKIRISTFGRGIWEADLQPPFANNDLQITSNTTWMTDRDLITDVVIKAGATLTINTGAVINIAKGKKISIEQGARLIVNGATLTNLCGEMWKGIEVRGNMNASQLVAGTQGVLDIMNGAVIENARFAVHASQQDANNNFIWGTFGGIIRVRDSFFKNNYHGIDFGPYQNFNLINNQPITDLSFIRNTEFSWDDNGNMIALGVLPISHIGMWDSHGIALTGNEFRNDASFTTYSPLERGTGILTFDAEFRLDQRCVSTTLPCTAFDKPQFANLTYGIKAENINAFNSITVKNSNFTNCLRGIYLKNMDFAEVVTSTFDVASELLGNPSYGIYLDNSNGYEIEENTFFNINSNATYGIYTKASGSTANEIYNNSLNNLQIANQTEGVNGLNTTSSSIGLIFRCNQNTGIADADIAVTLGVVNKNQGDCGTALSPANNLFSGATYDIWLSSAMPFMDYFYSSGNAQLVPTNTFPLGAANSNECFNLQQYNQSVNCPSRQQVAQTPVVLLANISTMRVQEQTLVDAIDNGQTATLLTTINSTAPAWQIKNALIAASPYLSENVLMAMLNRSPALPDWLVQQVLNANAPLTDNVFLAMLNRTPALPNHIIHQLAMESSPLSKSEQLALINRTPALPEWVITPVLIENSPLFDEVLIALMEHTPAFANWSIRNILVRNAPLSETVETVLLSKNYPNWLKNSISNSPFVAGDAIEKPQPSSLLLEQFVAISAVRQEIQLTENELFRTYLHDTTGTYGLTDVIVYLKQQGAIDPTDGAKRLSCALIKNGDFQNAQRTIDSLRTDTNLTAFCDFHTALNDLNQATPRTIDSLTNVGIRQTAETVANATTAGRERAGAEVLLEFSGFRTFTETFVPLNSNARTSDNDKNKPKIGTILQLSTSYKDDVINVYPNPNNGQFYVEYAIEEMQTGSFVLTDLLGQEIVRKPLQKHKGRIAIKEHLTPGIYLYQLIVNGEIFSMDKLIINN